MCPKFLDLACCSILWCQAMSQELAALKANQVEVVPLLPHMVQVGCKWIYKVKYLPNGQVERYKARLVARLDITRLLLS